MGARPGLGREGLPRHIRMGLHWKTHPVQARQFGAKIKISIIFQFFMFCFGAQVAGLKALGLYECFGGLGHNFERILEALCSYF